MDASSNRPAWLLCAWVGLLSWVCDAQAVPSVARQTGFECTACHVGRPELTTTGRQFELGGYALTKPATDGGRPLVAFAKDGNPPILPLAVFVQASASNTGRPIDAAAADKLLRDNKCFKCHAVDRKKDGPAYRDVAAKFRDKSDAVDRLINHITSGEMVKFADGHEEHHKKVKFDDPADLKNLAAWILSLEGGTPY